MAIHCTFLIIPEVFPNAYYMYHRNGASRLFQFVPLCFVEMSMLMAPRANRVREIAYPTFIRYIKRLS